MMEFAIPHTVWRLAAVPALRSDSDTGGDSCAHIGTRRSGSPYADDTAFEDAFTGAEKYTVKEIEVFEIVD
jgi:hypothetical protein